jgi:hypothetical protein
MSFIKLTEEHKIAPEEVYKVRQGVTPGDTPGGATAGGAGSGAAAAAAAAAAIARRRRRRRRSSSRGSVSRSRGSG